jgi:UDP-N-acetyl-D-mannosaminuronate dehydrogenase
MIYQARQANYEPELMSTARRVNDDVPRRVCDLVDEAFTVRSQLRGERGIVAEQETDGGTLISDSHDDPGGPDEPSLLVAGLTYKPGTSDVRSAVLERLVEQIDGRGYQVAGYDPHGDPRRLAEVFDIEMLDELRFDGFEGLIVPTAHPEFRSLDPAAVVAQLAEYPVVVDVDWTFDRETFADLPAVYRDL